MAKTMQPQKMRFSQAIQTPMYKNLVNNTLGDPARGARFIANITSAVAVNPALQECNPGTILAGALLGESLLLQPSPQLGQFYLVPFKSKAKRDRQGNVIEPASVKAQFVLGYKGYIQLALRTGQYKRLNVLEVKAGELSGWDPFEERFHEMHFIEDFEKRAAMPTVGYIAHFEYINGFEKTLYWTADQMMAHADKYSQAFSAAAYKKMDKQKIKSVPRLTTDNPVDNFQTALNFTDVSEDGWVWLRQPEMALTEYARQLVKGHGSSIDLGCNDMELSESLTDHLFDDPKQSIDGLIAEHYTILWAYATLREKLKWYEDAGIPVIPNYGLSTIRRAINRYGTAPQLQMAIKEMSELTKAICNLQRAVTFNYRNGAKIKVAHESVREEIADVYIMLAQLVEIVGKPEEVQQIVLEKLEQLKGDLDGGEVQSE